MKNNNASELLTQYFTPIEIKELILNLIERKMEENNILGAYFTPIEIRENLLHILSIEE
jgi:hypothetical protein